MPAQNVNIDQPWVDEEEEGDGGAVAGNFTSDDAAMKIAIVIAVPTTTLKMMELSPSSGKGSIYI